MSTPCLLPLPGESRPRAPLLPARDVELGLRRPGQRTEGRETGQRAMTCGWLGVCGVGPALCSLWRFPRERGPVRVGLGWAPSWARRTGVGGGPQGQVPPCLSHPGSAPGGGGWPVLVPSAGKGHRPLSLDAQTPNVPWDFGQEPHWPGPEFPVTWRCPPGDMMPSG